MYNGTLKEERMSDTLPELKTSLENPPYASLLGFRLQELSEGYAKVAVTIRPEHRNFLGNTDGGLVMSLADHAFASACNSHGDTRVAAQFNINFFAAAPLKGDMTAEARTAHVGRRIAVVDINVADNTGKIIAKATGTAITSHNQAQPKS